MEIRDRIKELRKVKASELLPNPKNWRKHPDAQANALRGTLSEIGYADALIAYETPEGLMLIDGHLRAETTPEMEVPVLITDLDESEANKLLATLDPLSAMAEADTDMLRMLRESVDIENQALMDMILDIESTGGVSEILESVVEEVYTKTVVSPIYTPTGENPRIEELNDRSVADKLIQEIEQAVIPEEIKQFLLGSAERHVVFNYERIANYYAHAPLNVQELMEQSALIIIDYDKAIENGFVRLSDDIDAAFNEDYPNA